MYIRGYNMKNRKIVVESCSTCPFRNTHEMELSISGEYIYDLCSHPNTPRMIVTDDVLAETIHVDCPLDVDEV